MLSYIILRSCVSLIKSNNFALVNTRVVCSLLHTNLITFNNMASEPGKDSGEVKGKYKLTSSSFRNWVTADGEFQPEKDRYHLYVSLACPFAHRTIITRKMKGLEDIIGMTIVDYLRDENGWSFTDQRPKTSLDTVNNCKYLREVYKMADPGYNGRITVPVFWDKKNKTIVNNESAEILRILNKQFNAFSATEEQRNLDLSPDDLMEAIEEINSWVAKDINEGVYGAGFATAQDAYDVAVVKLFKALDRVEDILSKSRYLCGDRLTEADIRLFTTLIRFDVVYVHHFKCNKKRIVDYPNLWGFTRDMYQTPGIGDTVDQEHIQKHYQMVHRHINPTGIVAIGPDLDFDAPHGRDVKFQK